MIVFLAISVACAAWLAYVHFAVPQVEAWPFAGRLVFVVAILAAVASL